MNKLSAMRPGLAKIIQKVRISWYFESPEADLHIAENACCIDYADTWSSKRVYSLSKSQSLHCCTSDYGCKDTLELYSGVTWADLSITRIHMWVASKPEIHGITVIVYNSGWVDGCDVCHGSIEAIAILQPVDVQEAYSHIASPYQSLQWRVWTHRGRDSSFGYEETQWKDDLFFTVKLARQKLSKYYAEVTPTTGMLLISAHILDPFRKLWSFRKCVKGMDINPEAETSYTTYYQDAFLKYVENEYCAKHRRVPVNKPQSLLSSNHISSATATHSYQSSFDPYDLSSDDDEYLMSDNVAEMTPRQRNHVACLLNAARLHLNSPPEPPKNWGQISPNLNDYHSDLMESGITYWILDITD